MSAILSDKSAPINVTGLFNIECRFQTRSAAKIAYQETLLSNRIVIGRIMLNRNQQPMLPGSHWHKVAEFSLLGEAGCEQTAANRVAEVLVNVPLHDQALEEVRQAVVRMMEKAMSGIVADQAQQAFTVLVLIQSVQSLETSSDEVNREALHFKRRGWGFFLTENNVVMKADLGNVINHIIISIHLYHEG